MEIKYCQYHQLISTTPNPPAGGVVVPSIMAVLKFPLGNLGFLTGFMSDGLRGINRFRGINQI